MTATTITTTRASTTITAPMTSELAEALAWSMYGTEQPAVVELLLLAANATTREDRFKALRCLEWFDPAVTEVPTRPESAATAPQGPVEEAIEALRWTLYGWTQASRARAAARAGKIITGLAAQA